ncbi:MAG: CARDB domain-containing protein, partial [Myxococcota bacterium]
MKPFRSVPIALVALTACGPDIRIAEMEGPATACPGEDIGPLVSLAVANDHVESVDETIQVGWYLSSDEALDTSLDTLLIGGRDQISGMAPMETVDVSVDVNTIPETTALGDHFLIAIADETDVVTEDNETNNIRARPLRIEACAGASTIELAAGGRQTCAVSDTGAIRCWGIGQYGVLGYGNTDDIGDNETPASVGDLPLGRPVIAVDAGFHHTCAVLDDGAVRCWGRNQSGQLGQGHVDDLGDNETLDTVPDIVLGAAAIDVAAGVYHSCALLDTGAVRCWGDASFGQLGYGTTEAIGENETPATAGDVPLGGTAVAIEAG